MSANIGGSPYAGELWSDINLKGKTPIIKEIVKSPQLFEMMVSPENVNKYMLIDFDEMNKTPGMLSELGDDYNFISKDGNVCRVKIDDTQFKNLIREVVNLTAKNKEVQNLIRDLIVTEMKNAGSSAVEINSMKADMDNMFNTLESQGFLDEFNQIMDKLKDVKILGDKVFTESVSGDATRNYLLSKGLAKMS